MALVATQVGFFYPYNNFMSALSNSQVVDATAEKVAYVGRIFIDGRPAAAKTISAAGGGKIGFRAAAVTFANGGTTLEFGIQDVAVGSGPPATPDGTFDVSRVLTGGGGAITANSWNDIALTGGSGSKSITHGDLIAVVFDMTARAGADTIAFNFVRPNLAGLGTASTTACDMPIALGNTGTWFVVGVPNVVITFDDGTLARIDFSALHSGFGADTYSDATNPDERGNIFQIPWDCKIDGFFAQMSPTDANSDCTIKLYSDPTGTPTLITSMAILAEQLGATATDTLSFFTLPTEVSLSKDTNYCISVLATGSSNIRVVAQSVADTNYRALLPGGTTVVKGTRDGSTGAFTAESPALTIYNLGVRISQLNSSAIVALSMLSILGVGT